MLPKEVRSHIRFKQSKRDNETAHWIWVGPRRQTANYGLISDHLAHRWIFQKFKGTLLEGERLKSVCKFPFCVNPHHWKKT